MLHFFVALQRFLCRNYRHLKFEICRKMGDFWAFFWRWLSTEKCGSPIRNPLTSAVGNRGRRTPIVHLKVD